MTRPESARGALNPFGTLAERLALIDDTVWYCHIAAETAGGDAILLSTWPDSQRIVLSQARLLPRFPAFLYGYDDDSSLQVDLCIRQSHAAGDKAAEITSMATLDAAPQFGAELKVRFV